MPKPIKELKDKDKKAKENGEKLGSDASGLMRATADCQIALLKLQNIQQQFIATGKAFFIAKYKKLLSEEAHVHLDALIDSSSTLKNETYINKEKRLVKQANWLPKPKNLPRSLKRRPFSLSL